MTANGCRTSACHRKMCTRLPGPLKSADGDFSFLNVTLVRRSLAGRFHDTSHGQFSAEIWRGCMTKNRSQSNIRFNAPWSRHNETAEVRRRYIICENTVSLPSNAIMAPKVVRRGLSTSLGGSVDTAVVVSMVTPSPSACNLSAYF